MKKKERSQYESIQRKAAVWCKSVTTFYDQSFQLFVSSERSQSNPMRPICVCACVLECCSRIGCTDCCFLPLILLFSSLHTSPLPFSSILSSSTSLSPPLSSHILLYFPLPYYSLPLYHNPFLLHIFHPFLLSIHYLIRILCTTLHAL
jgi:hypothetical protein